MFLSFGLTNEIAGETNGLPNHSEFNGSAILALSF